MELGYFGVLALLFFFAVIYLIIMYKQKSKDNEASEIDCETDDYTADAHKYEQHDTAISDNYLRLQLSPTNERKYTVREDTINRHNEPANLSIQDNKIQTDHSDKNDAVAAEIQTVCDDIPLESNEEHDQAEFRM